MRGSSCGWLRPRPPIPARTAGTVEAARRVAHEPMTAAGAGCPDLRQEVLSPGDVSGSPGTSRTSQIPPVSAQASPAMLREGVDLAGRPHDLPEGLQAQDFHGGWPAMCPLGDVEGIEGGLPPVGPPLAALPGGVQTHDRQVQALEGGLGCRGGPRTESRYAESMKLSRRSTYQAGKPKRRAGSTIRCT